MKFKVGDKVRTGVMIGIIIKIDYLYFMKKFCYLVKYYGDDNYSTWWFKENLKYIIPYKKIIKNILNKDSLANEK